jgi:hypothetical protein
MRCAVYVRVSTDRDEQKTSLDNQKSLFFNFIGQQGWDLYDFYVDVESRTTDNRAGFKKLIKDAENKKFDCILAKELSRLARNGELAYKIKRVLNSNLTRFPITFTVHSSIDRQLVITSINENGVPVSSTLPITSQEGCQSPSSVPARDCPFISTLFPTCTSSNLSDENKVTTL